MLNDSFEKTFGNINNTINIFYHLFAINDSLGRFTKTYNKIVDSGLIDKIDNVHVNIVGQNQEQIYNSIKNLYKVKCYLGTNDKNESETLNLMRNFCIKNPFGRSLYLHSKGVMRQNDPRATVIEGLQDWIDCMEYFLIEKHEKCLLILTNANNCGINYMNADTCGVNLTGWHYSGNFWWTTNRYLATTKPCEDEYMYCEVTFLFSGKDPKPYELHNTNFPWHQWIHRRYKREEYEIH